MTAWTTSDLQGHCLINGNCFRDNEVNPENQCEVLQIFCLRFYLLSIVFHAITRVLGPFHQGAINKDKILFTGIYFWKGTRYSRATDYILFKQ